MSDAGDIARTDQTLNIFKLPATDAAREASFIVSRDPSQGEDAFADYLDKQLAQCEKALPGYRLLLRRDYVCQGHLACWLDYQWRSDGRTLLLRQIFIERKPAVLIFT